MALKIQNEIYLTTSESATEICRATQTVYQNWKRWGWKPYYFGPTLLFKQSEIQLWLESQIIKGVR